MKKVNKKYLIFAVYIALLFFGYLFIKKINTGLSGFDYIFYLVYFLAISYLFFYQNFLKGLGEETAKVMLAEEKTTIEETVRTSFAKEKTTIEEAVKNEFATALAKFKSDLEKNRIAYQVDYSIYYTERSKALIDLYGKLAKLYETGSYLSALWEQHQNNVIESNSYDSLLKENTPKFIDAMHKADSAIHFCMLYLDNDLYVEITNFFNDVITYSKEFIKKDPSIEADKLYNYRKKVNELILELKKYAEIFRKIIQPKIN